MKLGHSERERKGVYGLGGLWRIMCLWILLELCNFLHPYPPFLRPDGKVLITAVYEDDKPLFVKDVIVFCQHDPDSIGKAKGFYSGGGC